MFDHIQPQLGCIQAGGSGSSGGGGGGGWAVDFIGRTEHIDEDLGAVLQELERRRRSDRVPLVSAGSDADAAASTGSGAMPLGGHIVEGGCSQSWTSLAGQQLTSAVCVSLCHSLHVKPLDSSLQNVNGRGCNESAGACMRGSRRGHRLLNAQCG